MSGHRDCDHVLARSIKVNIKSANPELIKDILMMRFLWHRHILDVHLAHDPEPGVEMQSLAQQSSHFLLAVSIRYIVNISKSP